jgi:hypothetical protein
VFLSVKTESARFVSIDEFADAESIIFREESVLAAESRFVKTVIKEGQLVAQNELVALVFDSPLEYDSFDNDFKFDEFENLRNIKNLKTKIFEEIKKKQLNQNLSQNNYNKILGLIYQKEKILGNFVNLAKNKNENKVPNFEKIKAKQFGYFSCFTDGKEGLKCDESTFNLDLNSEKPPPGVFGKIVISFECKILCRLYNEKDFDEIRRKDSVFIKFNLDDELTSCKILSADNKKIVLSACLNDDLLKYRHEKIKIKIRNVEGLKVKKSAIKENEGIPGVFIKHHKSLKFKKVDVLYEKDDFAICSPSSEIFSGDEVVISGLNLFDGKRVV